MAPSESNRVDDGFLRRESRVHDDAQAEVAKVGDAAEAISELAIAVRELPAGLDPTPGMSPWALRVAHDLVFESVLEHDPSGAPWVRSGAADRWVLDDELRPQKVWIHFAGRSIFHNGLSASVDDVAYSLERLRETPVPSLHPAVLANVERIQIGVAPNGEIDARNWIELTLRRPDPLILEKISRALLLPRELHATQNKAFAASPIGSGPLKARIESSHWTFWLDPASDVPGHRYANWQGPAQVVIREYTDGADAISALRRGDVHIVDEVASVHIPVELGKPGMAHRYRAWLRSPAAFDVVLYNLADGTMDDPAIRAALHDAIPVAQIQRSVFEDPGLTATAPIDLHDPQELDMTAFEGLRRPQRGIGGLPGFTAAQADLERMEAAGAHLDALGFKLANGVRERAGHRLRAVLTWDGSAGLGVGVSSRVRAGWRRLGVAEYHATAPWSYLSKLLARGRYETALLRFAYVEADDLWAYLHRDGDANLGAVADTRLEMALEKYRRAASREDRVEARARIAQRLMDIRLMSVVFAPAPVMLTDRRLTGIEWHDDLPLLHRLRWVPRTQASSADPAAR